MDGGKIIFISYCVTTYIFNSMESFSIRTVKRCREREKKKQMKGRKALGILAKIFLYLGLSLHFFAPQ